MSPAPIWANKLAAEYDFANYPEQAYRGRPVLPQFRGDQRAFAILRTRLRDAARAGPDFAGHYRIESIGCGTECTNSFIIDVKTGRITGSWIPHGDGEFSTSENLSYRPDSNLIFELAHEVDVGGTSCFYGAYLWDGARLRALAAVRTPAPKTDEMRFPCSYP